jgi:hypothetical protein
VKTHRVEERQDTGEWEIVHDETQVAPAKTRRPQEHS